MVRAIRREVVAPRVAGTIEATTGVTTGISAADRARTVQAASAKDAKAEDIVSPGHIFPLMAQAGGTLARAGHTEAACDLARMAGFEPSGVICEVMNDDGTMARLDDLIPFARKHGMKIGTIADLIAYRRRTERQVERVLETRFESAYGGKFRMVIYRNSLDQTEHVVLTKGDISSGGPVLVRMRSEPMTGADRAELARSLNEAPTEAFSPAEQARGDARRATAELGKLGVQRIVDTSVAAISEFAAHGAPSTSSKESK